MTARGAGAHAIGRKLNNAADAFTFIFLLTHTKAACTAMFAQILYRKIGGYDTVKVEYITLHYK